MLLSHHGHRGRATASPALYHAQPPNPTFLPHHPYAPTPPSRPPPLAARSARAPLPRPHLSAPAHYPHPHTIRTRFYPHPHLSAPAPITPVSPAWLAAGVTCRSGVPRQAGWRQPGDRNDVTSWRSGPSRCDIVAVAAPSPAPPQRGGRGRRGPRGGKGRRGGRGARGAAAGRPRPACTRRPAAHSRRAKRKPSATP
jgi:hypothetical protein